MYMHVHEITDHTDYYLFFASRHIYLSNVFLFFRFWTLGRGDNNKFTTILVNYSPAGTFLFGDISSVPGPTCW